MSLKGYWNFSVGDDIAWADYSYNDSEWDKIIVPKSWEKQGYEDYDGYAWYRKSFTLTKAEKINTYILKLGRIDDVDEVYINGKKIGGTGNFFPNYSTAWNIQRVYHIPEELLYSNKKNVIAVRVFDQAIDGGIMDGDVGLYYDKSIKYLEIDLSGKWKFAFSDPLDNPRPDGAELDIIRLNVPGNWESQGYPEIDGYGFYYKKIVIPESLKGQELEFVAGKIDDFDFIYFNGEAIGNYTDVVGRNNSYNKKYAYRYFRHYEIPEKLIKYNEANTLVVIVRDLGGEGGIIEGPVGIIKENNLKHVRTNDDEDFFSFWYQFYGF